MRFRVEVLGFRHVQGLGLRVYSGFRVVGFKVCGLMVLGVIKVYVSELRV